MYSYIACRICLVTDKQFKTLESDPVVREAYLNLVGVVYYNPLQTVCVECSTLLRKCSQLRQKCLRTNAILENILRRHGQVSYDIIKEVDRKTNDLESNLSFIQLNIDNIQSESLNEDYTPVKVEKNEELCSAEPLIIQYDPDDDNEIVTGNDKCKNKQNVKEENDHIKTEREYEFPVVEDNNIDEDVVDNFSVQLEISERTEDKKKIKCKKKNEAIGKSKDKTKSELQYDVDLIKEYAEIIDLTPEKARQELLLRKETNNFKSSPFKCDMCFKGFGVEVAFNNHLRKHSNEFGEWECDICHLRYLNRGTFSKHFYDCHKTKFTCKICPFICFGSKGIVLHIAMHKGKRFDCNMCNETFSIRSSLEAHKKKTHPRECVCDLCGKTFSTQRGLTLHKGLLHKKVQNEKRGPFCSECNIQFTNDTAWKIHLVLSSKHKVSNGCEYCGDTFNDSYDLRAHLRLHAGKHYNRQVFKVPSKCLKCDQWLENKTEYKEHMKIAHPTLRPTKKYENSGTEQHICEQCGKIYKQRILLVYHMRLHTGEKPYKCKDCGKEFMFSSGFCLHKQKHNKERVHCDVCGKSFGAKNALVKHLKLHSGIRPYKCEFCGKGYINRCEVRLHAKYVHYKEPWPKKDRNKKKKKNNEDSSKFSFLNN